MISHTSQDDEIRQKHLTESDELSLAAAQEALAAESRPDTLEVRDDSLAILHIAVSELRGPLVVAAAVLGTFTLLAVGAEGLVRALRGASAHSRGGAQ
jgi:hypothetical protein